jgi:plasmid rolling circle replication initiator protein Rep
MFKESEYVKNMRNAELQRIADHSAKENFKAIYKPQIEAGMTRSDFQQKHACTVTDLQLFEELEEEVRHEQELGEAFLKGFKSGVSKF